MRTVPSGTISQRATARGRAGSGGAGHVEQRRDEPRLRLAIEVDARESERALREGAARIRVRDLAHVRAAARDEVERRRAAGRRERLEVVLVAGEIQMDGNAGPLEDPLHALREARVVAAAGAEHRMVRGDHPPRTLRVADRADHVVVSSSPSVRATPVRVEQDQADAAAELAHADVVLRHAPAAHVVGDHAALELRALALAVVVVAEHREDRDGMLRVRLGARFAQASRAARRELDEAAVRSRPGSRAGGP